MSNRRKFNLGDIRRKLTEGQCGAEDAPEPSHKRPEGSSFHGNLHGTPPPSFIPGVDEGEEPSGSELPGQPVVGRKKQAFYGSSISSGNRPDPGDKLPDRESAQSVPGRSIPAAVERDEPKRQPVPPAIPPVQADLPDDEKEDEEAFDLHKYVGIILRRKHVVAFVTFIALMLSAYRYFKSDAYFVANARLLFRPDDKSLIDDHQVYRYWGDREKQFSTHLELLRSHTVLTMVAENLGDRIKVDEIARALTIEQGETGGEKNDIVELSFRHRDAETARDVLNELCRSYIEYRRNVNAQEITRLVGKFEFQIDKIQTDLSSRESALREFKEVNRMVELSNETSVTIRKLADMEMSLQQTQMSLLENRERLTELSSHIAKQELDIVQSATYEDPFRNRIAELELELNTLASEYSPEHFKVRMIRQQIDNLKAATADSMTREAASRTLVKNPIRESLQQQYIDLSIEKSALEAKRIAQERLTEKLNQELMRLPAIEQRFAYLQRETESLLQTLRMLKDKYEEAKIRRDSEESDLKILEFAQTPGTSISNVTIMDIVVGMLAGIVMGIGLALLLEYLDQTLKEPSSVEKSLGLPLLGIVPFIEADNAILEQSADLSKTALEPFRALRANIKHIAASHHLRTFIICSAIKGEGKTTLAANLGITFALDGKKVILVDADLRRSQAHTLFGIAKETGLSDYLGGAASIDDIVKKTRFGNMFVVTSGERPQNPAELLGTVRLDRLISELRERGDIVIFDSPALLPVSDTITMAPKMDGVLFVVRTFWTPLKAAKQALNQLERINSRLFGGILNGASHAGKYPYYYGYYGYYSYKYTYEEDGQKPFSLREAGLRIERSAKESLLSIRFGVPKYISSLSRGIGRIAKRRFFRLLVICLLLVTGARMMVGRNAPGTSEEAYVYLGSENGTARPDAAEGVGGNRAFANGPIAGPSSGTMDGCDGQDIGSGALDAVVRDWFEAFSERRLDSYLSFYDTAQFRFPDGGFAEWSAVTSDLFNSETGSTEGRVVLDTILTLGTDNMSVKLQVCYTALTASDSISGCTAVTWACRRDSWRIIYQKIISSKLSGATPGRRYEE